MMIPKIIHQIWIGNKPMPTKWMDSWVKKNPNFKHVIWDENKIKKMGLKNKKLYDRYITDGCPWGASDVVRAEILYKFGGVYLDADTECLESLEDAPFMERDFFAVYSPNLPDRVANGIMGITPKHPMMAEYIRRIGRSQKIYSPASTIGGTLLTQIVKEQGREKDILPAYTFLRFKVNGAKIEARGKVYANHYHASTKVSKHRYEEGVQAFQRKLIPIDKIDLWSCNHKKTETGFVVNASRDGQNTQKHIDDIKYIKGIILSGEKILPALVFDNKDGTYRELDGFKRTIAYMELGRKEIEAFVCDKHGESMNLYGKKMVCRGGGQTYLIFDKLIEKDYQKKP